MKLILVVEYNGTAYSGWQRQPNALSVQEFLENAVSRVANENVKVFCASRTDSGVHAIAQVVHFDTNSVRSSFSWMSGINRNLPVDIVVRWVSEAVDMNFHSRFSAVSRKYRYIIYNCSIRSALLIKRVGCYKKFLDVKKMRNSSKYLLGEQDFTSFRSLKCQSSSAFRNIHHLSVVRYGNYVIFDIEANSFLYHMVRNIVGSLVEVGLGHRSEHWIAELLLKRNRSLAGGIAPPHGLYLMKIEYPLHYAIPNFSNSCNLMFV